MAKYIQPIDPNIVNQLIQGESFSPIGSAASTVGQAIGGALQAKKRRAEENENKAIEVFKAMKDKLDFKVIEDKGKVPVGYSPIPKGLHGILGPNVYMSEKKQEPKGDPNMIKVSSATARELGKKGYTFKPGEQIDKITLNHMLNPKEAKGKTPDDKFNTYNKQITALRRQYEFLAKQKEAETISEEDYNKHGQNLLKAISDLESKMLGLDGEKSLSGDNTVKLKESLGFFDLIKKGFSSGFSRGRNDSSKVVGVDRNKTASVAQNLNKFEERASGVKLKTRTDVMDSFWIGVNKKGA